MAELEVEVYDTTLRDGTQREGISLSSGDKLKIARRLDALGVAFIEGGWPGSNPKDAELFRQARDQAWRSELCAFGSTRRAELAVEDDPGLRALLRSGARTCTLFGKSWRLHVAEVLRTSDEDNLKMIEESLAFLRAEGRRVIYDAEHFFDGYRDDPVYALETLRAAVRGGAETVVLCDTNGGSLPWQIFEVVSQVARALRHPLGIHAHDDGGCGVANTLEAVRAGARHVQGTINGYGERCGNANLCAVMPDLELKLGLRCLPDGALGELYEVAHFVAEVANLQLDEHLAYVGRSAFAHKGGVHVAAMRRAPSSYQHIDPARVGNSSRQVVSELSGRANVLGLAESLGLDLSAGAELEVLGRIKEREARGFSFEAAEASTALLLRRRTGDYQAPFQLVEYRVVAGQVEGRSSAAEATIKILVGDRVVHTAAEGNGPVSALDAALRKALEPTYPQVREIQLVDYKVRILDGREGTAATTRVLIDSSDGKSSWSTVGAAASILEASWQALADSIEFGLNAAEGKRVKEAQA
ncbi:MAG TPA: citramalate synthase [Polyangia bacterium]|jgi:2-isopropylmalate synthase